MTVRTLTVKSAFRTITFDGTTVAIRRARPRSLLAKMGAGGDRAPLYSVTAIELTPPTTLARGSIRFTVGQPRGTAHSSAGIPRVITVTFGRRRLPEFEALQASMQEAKRVPTVSGHPHPQPSGHPAPPLSGELMRLARLFKAGAVSAQEYLAMAQQVV